MSFRHGSRAALHLPVQEVEEEAAISSSRGPSAYLPSCQARYRVNLFKNSKKCNALQNVCCAFVFVCQHMFLLFIELDIGLKKDALLSADGSSLEALLKGDSLEKRMTTDLRGSEEDSNQSDYTGGLNPAARIRKVPFVSIRSQENDLTFQLYA